MKKIVYVLIRKKDEILILKRPSDKKKFPNCWNLPGGKLDEPETELDCAIREVMEETNLKLSLSKKIYELTDLDNKDLKVIFYEGTATGDIKINEEHVEYSWVKLKDLHTKKITTYIQTLLKEINSGK